MGTGYTRADTLNNIADGNIINASDIDSEYDAIEAAFNETTGHTHDGTAAEGAPITVLGPVQDFIASATEIKPKTTNTLDIGTNSLQFKDMYLDGTAYLDDIQAVGAVDITGDLDVDNININGNTIISTDTNGNIALTPNGTGEVDISKVDIDSGAIDGTVIGASSAAAITGTTITGTSFVSSGDMTFGDNDKAIFGAGSDLQIYHDGSDSYISEGGTGDLKIQGANVRLENPSGVRYFQGSSGVSYLYNSGDIKLNTTATGVDVTGTITSDGLTIDSNTVTQNGTLPFYLFMESDTTDLNTQLIQTVGQLRVRTVNDAVTSSTERLRIDHSTGDISFYEDTGTTAKFFWDASAESLGIGTSSPSNNLEVVSSDVFGGITVSGANAPGITFNDTTDAAYALITTQNNGDLRFFADESNVGASTTMEFHVDGSEAMRIDSSGNLLVGKTASNVSTDGLEASGSFGFRSTRSGGIAGYLNRKTSDGNILVFAKDTTTVGSIGSHSGSGLILDGGGASNQTGFYFSNPATLPVFAGSLQDDRNDLGSNSWRFDDIYATNVSIQTSDANEKQQIAALTDAEITAAKAISKLFKTFKWNSAVTEKGDAARTHTGVIAQDVQQAMTAAGLDAGDYAFFISSTWWETQTDVPAVAEETDEDGNVITEAQEAYTRTDTYDTAEEAPEGATERTRLGIRYPELLAFIGAATEQRLADIETRLTALENA